MNNQNLNESVESLYRYEVINTEPNPPPAIWSLSHVKILDGVKETKPIPKLKRQNAMLNLFCDVNFN
jgi:hypothetical protein